MSEDRLAADLFAARKRALDYSDKPALSSMPPRIQRQYERFADELRPLLAQGTDAPLADDTDLSAARELIVDAILGYDECEAGPTDNPGELGARIDGRAYRIVIVPQADNT